MKKEKIEEITEEKPTRKRRNKKAEIENLEIPEVVEIAEEKPKAKTRARKKKEETVEVVAEVGQEEEPI